MNKIEKILRKETCNLFSDLWYKNVVLEISIEKVEEEMFENLDFSKIKLNQTYDQTQISNLFGLAKTTRSTNKILSAWCKKNNYKINRWKSNGVRCISINS